MVNHHRDGRRAPLGHPTYNHIVRMSQARFPTTPLTGSLSASLTLDTTKLANGMPRSFGWCTMTTSRRGIGSRYFTAANLREMCGGGAAGRFWHRIERLSDPPRGGSHEPLARAPPASVHPSRWIDDGEGGAGIFASGWKNGAAAGWINAEGRRALLQLGPPGFFGRISARVDSSDREEVPVRHPGRPKAYSKRFNKSTQPKSAGFRARREVR